MLIQRIYGAVCVLRSKGTYRQCGLYSYGDKLLARVGGAYIALRRDNMTTRPDIFWEVIDGVRYRIDGFSLVTTNKA